MKKVLLFLLLFACSVARAQYTPSPNLGFQLPNSGDTTNWNTYINGNFTKVDSLLGGVYTFFPNTATPSVLNNSNWKTANTASTTITNFLNGFQGQSINVFCGDSFTSIVGSANINIPSPFTCPSGSSVSFVLVGSVWQEVGQFSVGPVSGNAISLQGVAVSPATPSSNQCLVFNGTAWVPGSCSGSSTLNFNSITSGTNVSAAMLVGSGASLDFTGSGTIDASSLNSFFTVAGPNTSLKTFTFPNASATVLTSNAPVTVVQGGTGANTAPAALINLLPTATRAGDLIYCSTFAAGACTAWSSIPGNNTGTQYLQETSVGLPSWTSPLSGSVTNVSGTANQINVANPTTTPALSLSSTLILPGTLTVSSGNITTNVTGSTQCLHVNSSGVVSGTGGDCISSGGAGTVTSVSTTAPVIGGTITTSGTISCPTCVVSSSPGAGIAHFAGSTQAVTSSAVSLTADVSGLLPKANGGTGTATPSLVAGTNITVTGSWPNQTVNSTSGGGTVTSVIGTANQITVTSPTTTPTLSFPSAVIAPGSVTALTEVDSGSNGGSSGVFGLLGSTSGKATITAPAVAGTTTNPVVFSNSIQAPNISNLKINTPVVSVTTSPVAISSSNCGNELVLNSGASALTIPVIGTIPIGCSMPIWNLGSGGTVSLTPTTSSISGGSSNVISGTVAYINQGDECFLTTGTSYTLSCTSQSDIVVPTGVDPTGTVDSYAAMQASLNAALGSNRELYIPPGVYLTSATLTTGGSIPVKIRGGGSYNDTMGGTIIKASSTGYDVLSIGVGNGSFVDAPSGYLTDITLVGDSNSANSGYAPLQINGMPKYVVERVLLEDEDVGLDFINNSFGAHIKDIRILNVNAGIYLRTGSQSGSDITFDNAWVESSYGAVWISPGGGGYHFFGGQLGANNGGSGVNDNDGTIVLGKDWITGSTSGGDVSADFHGTSFEDTNYVWAFRAFEQARLNLYGISINPANAGEPAIGVFKGTGMDYSIVTSDGTALSGYFSGTALLSFANINSGLEQSWFETGTYSAGQNPTINGTPTYVGSMCYQSFGLNNNCYSNAVDTGTQGWQFIARNQFNIVPAFGSQRYEAGAACETSYGATTVSGGATTTTGLNCLPANAIIDAVVYRITTTITTATSFTIGDSGSATRYCGTQSTLTAGTTGTCTAAGYYHNSSAAGVLITPSTTPGAGAIRLIVYYHTWVPPTS